MTTRKTGGEKTSFDPKLPTPRNLGCLINALLKLKFWQLLPLVSVSIWNWLCSGQTKTYKNWYLQLSYLTFSSKKKQRELRSLHCACTVDRWQVVAWIENRNSFSLSPVQGNLETKHVIAITILEIKFWWTTTKNKPFT